MNPARGAVLVALGAAVAALTAANGMAAVRSGAHQATSSSQRQTAIGASTLVNARQRTATVRASGRLPAQALHHRPSHVTGSRGSESRGSESRGSESAAARRARLARMRADPARNVAPDPGYSSCWTSRTSAGCVHLELAAINHARAAEGVKPMVLPHGFGHLSSARQVFVLTDLERTARGLRPFVALVRPLDTLASVAARDRRDPSLPSWTVGRAQAWRWVSNWADDINALAADYDYMYDDGYSPSDTINGDCTSAHSSGCWSHRHNILLAYRHLPLLIAGAAEVGHGQLESSAILMVGAKGRSPRPVFTWHHALRHRRALRSAPFAGL